MNAFRHPCRAERLKFFDYLGGGGGENSFFSLICLSLAVQNALELFKFFFIDVNLTVQRPNPSASVCPYVCVSLSYRQYRKHLPINSIP